MLVSEKTSTRAIALDSLILTREPFALVSQFGGSQQRTRLMLFAMNLNAEQRKNLALFTAEAEDLSARRFSLPVECVEAMPGEEWLSLVVVRLNDDLTDVGDVLVRVVYNGASSNRVRIGIGHLGGGLPDDIGSQPTPVHPFSVAGEIRDDNNQPLSRVQVVLMDQTEGSVSPVITNNSGGYTFNGVSPGHDIQIVPTDTATFRFNSQLIPALPDDRIVNFKATRALYSIKGKVKRSPAVGPQRLTVVLGGHLGAAVLTDENGNYTFNGLPAGFAYTITVPTSPYFEFADETTSYLSENTVLDIESVVRNYAVSGRVSFGPNDAPPLQLAIEGSQSSSVTTDAHGRYSVTLQAGGNYTLNPGYLYYNFAPVAQIVSDLNADQINRDFNGTRQSFAISGRIADQNNQGIDGVFVNLTGQRTQTTITNSGGTYQFSDLDAGYAYAVTPPSTTAYTFSGQAVTNLTQNEHLDFTGLWRFTLSGKVKDSNGAGIIGITVTLSGSETATTITAADGSYAIDATATGNYTLTPAIPQDYYDFAPAQKSLTNLASSQTLDFTATLAAFPSPAYVLEFNGQPKTVDYYTFWRQDVDLGHFFWEFWAMPGPYAGATYMLSDGYGGAHALLFGVASLGSAEAGRYRLLGNIFDGVKFANYFSSDQGPAPGEWAHMAVGWDGQNIVTYYNGVPVGKTRFVGPRRTPGPGGGGGRLLIGGSDHSNFEGRIAQVRGYEDRNPREEGQNSVESSFAPQSVFSVEGSLLSWYFRKVPTAVADLSQGYGGATHTGVVRGTLAGILFNCENCAPPLFVIDPGAPNFVTATAPAPLFVPTPPPVPAGALVSDSFSRPNATLVFNGNGGLGATEAGSEGSKVWLTGESAGSRQPFGVLNGVGVLLANKTAVAWVPIASANLDVRVARRRGVWKSGANTGLSFRASDSSNYFFAYTSDNVTTGQSNLSVGYFQDGVRHELTSGIALPADWITLRVITQSSGAIQVVADGTLLTSLNSPLLANANGAGLYNNGPGLGLTNRWDNFSVFAAP